MADTSPIPTVNLNTKELAKLAAALWTELNQQRQANASTIADIKANASNLLEAVHKIAASHSGSDFGYHGTLYYGDFEAPSLGHLFNVEWGGLNGISPGWRRREPDEVKERIEQIAGMKFGQIESAIKSPLHKAKELQRDVLIQLAPLHHLPEGNREKQLLASLEQYDWKDSAHNDYVSAAIKSYPNMTRDSAAFTQGFVLTPHDYYGAAAMQLRRSCEAIEEFWTATDRLLRQVEVVGTSKLVDDREQGDSTELAAKYERLRIGALLVTAFSLSLIVAAGAEYVIRKWRWEWLLSNPNSYSIQWLTYAVLLLFLVGLFVRQFRNYCWGIALIPLLVGVLQSLGGPRHSP